MKCIHFYMPDNRVLRVSDDEAHAAVKSGKARYVAKHVWKKATRESNRA